MKPGMCNVRQRVIIYAVAAACFLAAIALTGSLSSKRAVETHVREKNLMPNLEHPFGTDWLGRDMLARTLKGLSISISIGIFASAVSACLAALIGTAAATLGKGSDELCGFLVNTVMGIPHILLLMLISYALGKGMFGVITAVAVSHWPSLSRVIRAEMIQLREAPYIHIARKLGVSPLGIAKKHLFPHIFPQFAVGLILLFPHAILHEASLTFLGFGLRPDQPGIGIILSESMKYLSLGMWHLAFFPGIALLATVLLFDVLGSSLRKLLDPHSAQL